ncbi:MAG: hypothetical protein GY732_12405, partial [Gammaproteobacteria bacterium]|nr:hypothetical protein [Gammaproteobacteria bacterium]
MANGGVTLCLEANGFGICGPVSDCMFIEITPLAVASAGEDATVCESGSYQLSATAENYSSLIWETNGDGNFDDPVSLTANYTPGENDIDAGTVELCLNLVGINDCEGASDCMTLIIQSEPEAYAGIDATIFNGDSYPLMDASADNFEGILWTTTGTGVFIPPGDVNPIYIHTNEDFVAGAVILKIAATAKDPCTIAAMDEMTLTILEECEDAVAVAGNDFIACLPGEVMLNGNAEHYASVLWETNGDGSFVEPINLASAYIPGDNDLTAGFVEVCLTAFAKSICQNSTDCVHISFTDAPVVATSDDITICETDGMVPLNALAEHYSDVVWTTSGNGFFQDNTSLETAYILGPDDLLNGEVTLTIMVNSELCPSVSDEIAVSISPSVILYPGEDATICDYETFTTSEAFVSNAASTEWTTSGDGTFADASSTITEYFPGENDITNGEVELCLSAIAISPCDNASQCITLTILPSASVNAGEDDIICETEIVMLTATAEYFSGVLWSTSGDGTFDDPSILNSEYTPGEQDKLNGNVTLTIDVTSSTGCNDASDDIVINIDKAPVADAGDDFTVCFPGEVMLNGTAENYSSKLWTTKGDGSFTYPEGFATQYLPGEEDIAAGFVEVCLKAFADGVCTDAEDCITITLTNAPVVEAGDDITICETDGMVPLNALAEHYADVVWTTSGNGFFQDNTSLETAYILGPDDLLNGEVTLTIMVNSELCPS